MTAMTEPAPTPKQIAGRKLMVAAFIEGALIFIGLFSYFLTGDWVLLAVGLIGGTSLTIAAIISFVSASMEERSRASR